ncbi:hypothetical protein Daura_04125 [Dactylosporangium aurantiacum]|uniref:Uncharacterized protein n=1 Tax=Dactylosporangium aurantiacum TaxID=35754 RepID=A0A9Q9MK92_9ACTN|nr:hypothetical protein [Dactylosporangium aurantiacum]MDG6109438.1 hypothetical protein [Dactylosporangium aurantiacum]UWZ55436.1 hypothetical protein Daura_04125 [Dactylosporangium aurantiacum]
MLKTRLSTGLLTGIGIAVATVGLFFAYLRMAYAFPINSDGASNALQAWDMFHGNPLLTGWTLSDVAFYPTELIQYAMIQVFTGPTVDQIHIAAAITYTMIVLLSAVLAKGRATGLQAWLRVGVTVAILLVPVPGTGYQTLLSSPNHTGSAVPLLLAWGAIDRMRDTKAKPVVVALLLAWGAWGDPLVTFVGAVPLALVCLVRAWRLPGSWRDRLLGTDFQLAVAAGVSVVLSHAATWGLKAIGGYHTPKPPIELSPWDEWFGRAHMTARMLGVLFGTHRPGWQSKWIQQGVSYLHLIGFLVALVAVVIVIVRTLRGTADRVDSIMAVAICCDIGAEIVSTLPVDLMAAREISPVLPMAAVLAGRIVGPRLTVRWRQGVLVAVLALLTLNLVAYAPPRAEPSEGQVVADWLAERNLTYGLGGYWVSNNITVTTHRKVTVAPVIGDVDRVIPMCWQSKTSMYDVSHDARFIVFEKDRPFYGTPAQAVKMWGAPKQRFDTGRYAVMVYDRNLLDGFPPPC